MRPLTEISNRITVVPCVDHEPTSAGADGNHGSGLERYWYGSVGQQEPAWLKAGNSLDLSEKKRDPAVLRPIKKKK